MLTEAFLTGATGQILFCAVCVNVFVCLGKYDIHNIYMQHVVKIHKPIQICEAQFFCYLLVVSLGMCARALCCVSVVASKPHFMEAIKNTVK